MNLFSFFSNQVQKENRKRILFIFLLIAFAFIVITPYLWLQRNIRNAKLETLRQCELAKHSADSLHAFAVSLLDRHSFDSAMIVLYSVNSSEYTCLNRPAIYDSIYELKRNVNILLKYIQNGYVKKVLREMSQETYQLLCNEQFNLNYFNLKQANDYFTELLYNDRNNRSKYIKEEKVRLSKIAAEEAKREREMLIAQAEEKRRMQQAESKVRKLYQEGLRTAFLDRGMDVNVLVTGKNNTRLVLTYPLFNDVWYRKYDREGEFDGWHNIGFNRIDLKNNYDYHRYVYWPEE